MALATPCQTRGATYTIGITDHKVFVAVELGRGELVLDKDELDTLEANLHNAVELVLAPVYRVSH